MIKDVKGYEGLYCAKSDGTIWSCRSKKALRPYVNAGGYLRVNLYDREGRAHHEYVHRLIAESFINNPRRLPEVNHINAHRDDNRAVNLEWCDRRDNVEHALNLGRWSKKVAVVASNTVTGEVREYPFLKYAARDLFGAPHRLQWLRMRYGDHFTRGDWDIFVRGGGAV